MGTCEHGGRLQQAQLAILQVLARIPWSEQCLRMGPGPGQRSLMEISDRSERSALGSPLEGLLVHWQLLPSRKGFECRTARSIGPSFGALWEHPPPVSTRHLKLRVLVGSSSGWLVEHSAQHPNRWPMGCYHTLNAKASLRFWKAVHR